MNNKKRLIGILLEIILIAITLIIYFNIGKNVNIKFINLISILINEIIIYLVINKIIIKNEGTFKTSGKISATFIYTLVNVGYNCLFHMILKNTKNIILINVLILLIYIFTILLIELFYTKKEKSNESN